jgi:dolichol-phosphate mannosyltransferase
MIAVGILGEYVGRIYEEGKGRPLYVVADAWNLAEPKSEDNEPAPVEGNCLRHGRPEAGHIASAERARFGAS